MKYYKANLKNGYTIYFDAASKEAANQYASYKATLQTTSVVTVKQVTRKEAVRIGLDVDETV